MTITNDQGQNNNKKPLHKRYDLPTRPHASPSPKSERKS